MADQRALGTDHGTGGADTADRRACGLGVEFLPVIVMGHDGDVLATLDHALEQPDQFVRIGRGVEAVGPEGQRLGADADGLDVIEIRVQQRLEIGLQMLGLHHHRVAAGKQQVGDLGVVAQVVVQFRGFGGRDAQLLVADELGPAEAEGAVAVAGLPLAREEQHRFTVLVLHAFEATPIGVARHVHFHLVGRMGIEFVADLVGHTFDLGLVGAAAHHRRHALEVLRREHPALREGELEDRIGRDVAPVDQFVDDVLVDAERQHRRYDSHLEAHGRGQPCDLVDLFQVALGEHLEGNDPVGLLYGLQRPLALDPTRTWIHKYTS